MSSSGAAPRPPRFDWQIIRTLLPYVWNYRGRSLVAVLLLVIAKVATVGLPLLLKRIVDRLDGETDVAIALPLGLLLAYGAVRLGATLFRELQSVVFAQISNGIIRHLSIQVLRHLHALSLRFHLERHTGAIARDIERGTGSVSALLSHLLFNILPTLVEVGLVATLLLVSYDVWFSVVTVLTVALYAVFTFVITRWRIGLRATMNASESKANSQAIDSLLNYETVKYFGNERFELRRYDESLATWESAATRSQTSLALLNAIQGAIIAAGVTILMILAARGVVARTLTIGDLVAVNAFLLQLFIPLGFLGTIYSMLKSALSDMERMFSLLEIRPEIQDAPGATRLRADSAAVRFSHVQFGYDPERQVLFDVDFDIPSGRKVAVVGPSGAGKSTLARLLCRFYDVSGGSILVNGQDIRQVTQESLRELIGIVPQDTVLFNDTIFYNIVYGRLDASVAEVHRAAELAHIHHFITTLPQGYDTVVGERGLKLSGGEKQRVAIARAILKNPKILIFDEATSSLDSGSEQHILRAMRAVAQHHTTLIVAHRLSTIVDADEILVMESGRIVERGAHGTLLASNGTYAQLWRLQQEERHRDRSQASPELVD